MQCWQHTTGEKLKQTLQMLYVWKTKADQDAATECGSHDNV